jgi:hypothetical protein
MTANHRRTFVSALLAQTLLALASAASAQDVTVYGTEAEYDAVAGTADACLDFDGSTQSLVSGASFSGAVTFGSPEAFDPTQVNWSSDAVSDAGTMDLAIGVGSMDGSFATAVQAFKVTFLSNSNAPTVALYAGDGTLLASVSAPNAPGFLGVVSTTPVARFVITPANFPGSISRDRFFLDDFCWTTTLPGPEPEPEPETDPAALCHELADAIAAAPAEAFRGRNRQRALGNKMEVVCRRIEAGDEDSLRSALQKLLHDLHPKCDGERGPKDWVTDATVQAELEAKMETLVAALQDALGEEGASADDDGHGHGHGRGRNK